MKYFIVGFVTSFAMGAFLFAMRSFTENRQAFYEEMTMKRGIWFFLAVWSYLLSIPLSIILISYFISHG